MHGVVVIRSAQSHVMMSEEYTTPANLSVVDRWCCVRVWFVVARD